MSGPDAALAAEPRLSGMTPFPKAPKVDPSDSWPARFLESQDGAIQSLYGLGLKLEHCIELVDDDPARAKLEIEGVIARLDGLIREARNRIFDLEPADPGNQDFTDALASLLRELSVNTLMSVDISMPADREGDWLKLNSEQQRALIDVARCALANVREHSRAHSVHVDLGTRDGRFFMRVDDDGVGFDVKALPVRPGGLVEMRELALHHGGSFTLKSSPGEGTSVDVEMPLEADQ